MTGPAIAGTESDKAVLAGLDWDPVCELGRRLVTRDGSSACRRIAKYSAVVHRCATPGTGILVLLCGLCVVEYQKMAVLVAQYPPGACTCSICGATMTPKEVIHSVQHL